MTEVKILEEEDIVPLMRAVLECIPESEPVYATVKSCVASTRYSHPSNLGHHYERMLARLLSEANKESEWWQKVDDLLTGKVDFRKADDDNE